jgi:hypothetical protein
MSLNFNAHNLVVLVIMLGGGIALMLLGHPDAGQMLLAGGLGFATPQAGQAPRAVAPSLTIPMPEPLPADPTPKA